jgi:hypothetical protein
MIKLNRVDHNGEPIEFFDLSEHEQLLLKLISGANGNYQTLEGIGASKGVTVRFNSITYPKIKALADLSGNSLNSVVNDLVEVAFGIMIDNMSEDTASKLFEAERAVLSDVWGTPQSKEKK